MSPTETVSVIVVSWNSWNVLPACLRAIDAAAEAWSGRVEVVVVDNASEDGTVVNLDREFPAVRVLPQTQNHGFPKACNMGLAVATGESVLMLNPDVEIAVDTFQRCVARLDADPSVGLLGVRLIDEEGVTQPESARRFPSEWWLLCEALYLHKLAPKTRLFGGLNYGEWDHLSERYVPCIVGAFMLFRGSVLRELGGFDESVFMYFEDVDICQRIWNAGWRVLYLPEPAAAHQAGTSRGKADPDLSASLDALKGEVAWRFTATHRRPHWRVVAIKAEIILYALVRLVVLPGTALALHGSMRNASYGIRVNLSLVAWALRRKAT